MKLYLDPGHGGSDPGAVGNGLREKDITLDIAKRIKNSLENYSHVDVKLSRTRDMTKSLITRTYEANTWGADIFLSIHCNAFNGNARGYEDFIYNGLKANAASIKNQKILHISTARSTQLPNRGMKQANFHVLRESKMPAILTENGFIDHPEDARLMKQAAWREQVAIGHVEGLVSIFRLKGKNYKQEKYAIIAGSFQHRTNAEGRTIFLDAKGITSHVQKVKLGKNIMYRVRAGTYATRNEAEKQLLLVRSVGVEGFIMH